MGLPWGGTDATEGHPRRDLGASWGIGVLHWATQELHWGNPGATQGLPRGYIGATEGDGLPQGNSGDTQGISRGDTRGQHRATPVYLGATEVIHRPGARGHPGDT